MAQVVSSRPSGISRRRIHTLLVVCLALASLTTRQLVQIQVYKHVDDRNLTDSAQQELNKHVVLQPRRGTIYDRNGAALALNVYRDSLYVEPARISDPEKLAIVLAPIIGKDVESVAKIITNKDREWDRLARWLSTEASDRIKALGKDGKLPEGLHLIPEAQRAYPQNSFAARIVGVANHEGDGISGVEGFYDSEIKGITGTLRAEQDAAQRPIWIAPQKITEPQDGADLTLTIDSTVQRVIEHELEDAVTKHRADGGSIVVMDPSSGELLGMASAGSFDPNHYTEVDPELYNHNAALTDVYEPGSTFKVILTAIGLQTGKFTADTTVNDPGSIQRYGWTISNWNKAGHGPLTPARMLFYSSNVAALQFAELVGRDDFYKYVKLFGYGQPTGIDMAGEAQGIVNWPIGPNWSDLYLDQNGFGQSIAVTPLQHLTAISAIANGGMLMRPHVVKRQCKGTQCEDIPPTPVRRVVDQAVTDQINNMLVENANGAYAPVVWGPITNNYQKMPLVPGFRVTAKTGTSQIAVNGGWDNSATIGSVVGWAPAEQPRIAVLVKIDRPKDDQWGVNTAIPVYQKVVSQLMTYYRLPPNPDLIDPAQVGK
jgi:cell division protein FtsI (penicillin-binding protein 3)